MITTINLVNIHPHTQLQNLFLLSICSVNTIGMLDETSPWLMYFSLELWYVFTAFGSFPFITNKVRHSVSMLTDHLWLLRWPAGNAFGQRWLLRVPWRLLRKRQWCKHCAKYATATSFDVVRTVSLTNSNSGPADWTICSYLGLRFSPGQSCPYLRRQ